MGPINFMVFPEVAGLALSVLFQMFLLSIWPPCDPADRLRHASVMSHLQTDGSPTAGYRRILPQIGDTDRDGPGTGSRDACRYAEVRSPKWAIARAGVVI